MNNFRPKVNFPKTGLEIAADIVGIGALMLSFVFILLNWGAMPSEIPAHFDFEGNVDRYGSKVELLILPIIALVMLVLLQVLEKKPWLYNYPARLNDENIQQFYTEGRKLLNYMKNSINIFFAYICVQSVRISLGQIESLGQGLLMGIVGVITAIIIFSTIRMIKIK